MVFVSTRAGPPTRRHLRHWERVCCYLDAQPYRAVSLPLPGDPPMSVRLFKRMALFRLVHHRDDCRWQLSPRWRAILQQLWEGLPPDDPANAPAGPESSASTPFIVDTGVDTLYVNLKASDGLPAALMHRCDASKAVAQAEDRTVETPWLIYGAPLSLYKSGVGTRAKGRGVSWSYILRNSMVMLLLRKSPLSGLVGSARLSAECLWTYGARGALDRLRDDLALMWASSEPGSFQQVAWQLSQIHLCADVANFAPDPTYLSRLLTRSRKRAIHIPSLHDVEAAAAWNLEADAAFDDAWLTSAAPPAWEVVPLDLLDLASFATPFSDREDDNDRDDDAGGQDEGDVAYADEAGAAVHLWGQRTSGFAFSPGGDLSAVWYDKLLEERASGKRWMEAIHAAGGWQLGMPLTRVEARFRRGVLRELAAQQHIAPGTAPVRWFDDPWECLDHLQDLWAFFAGLPPEADVAPDVTHRGWMRLAVLDGVDANRSRWQTDPIWETVQRARFHPDTTPGMLTRQPRIRHDLAQVDAELYGLLKLRAVLRGEYLDITATLSQELHAFANQMDEEDAKRGRDFAEEVREKARMLGKPVPIRTHNLVAPVEAAGLTGEVIP
ncbi:MAG TPA: hypothetical protein VGS80_25890 [Ktedonobacterales bacterium]|nr:hypothetical protein [Ktedonobacterales bacterium]